MRATYLRGDAVTILPSLKAELNEEGNTSQKRERRGRLPQMRPCLGKFLSISE